MFGRRSRVVEPLAVMEPRTAEGVGLSAQQQHHAEILARFHASAERVAHGEAVAARAAGLHADATLKLAEARESAEGARRLLRRVAEGHV